MILNFMLNSIYMVYGISKHNMLVVWYMLVLWYLNMFQGSGILYHGILQSTLVLSLVYHETTTEISCRGNSVI